MSGGKRSQGTASALLPACRQAGRALEVQGVRLRTLRFKAGYKRILFRIKELWRLDRMDKSP